jgi:uncharacterized membrane protein (UPF0127 family)
MFIKISLFLSFLVLLLNPTLSFAQNETNLIQKYQYKDGDIVSVIIGKNKLNLEAAKSYSAKARGLSKRDRVPQDGMIFFFETESYLTFWMKDMIIPIDIVWIKNNKVIGFIENVPPEPNTPDNALKQYYPPSKCDIVIELNAGAVKKLNIKAGDTMSFAPSICKY